MTVQVVILAAGLGTRLGRPHPKPLTPLASGRSILAQQVERIGDAFGNTARILIVVGFRMDLITASFPAAEFVSNDAYRHTNTSRSLLEGLLRTGDGGVLWMNGDVVFDTDVLPSVRPLIQRDRSFVCVNTEAVGDEEVTYTVDDAGWVRRLSKQARGGLGEAVGINYISAGDKQPLVRRLADCDDQDYFERGIELAILHDGLRIAPVDISAHRCIEVDVEDDLARANSLYA